MMPLSEFLLSLGLKVNNLKLIENAFVHRSYLNESNGFAESNERLEYLGDAVLELATSEYLYHRYPSYQEGMLTNLRASLVKTTSLAALAELLDLPAYLRMSKGEEATGGRSNVSILANTFEALLGAIYLDSGYEPCKTLLQNHLFPRIDQVVKEHSYKDNKSLLQEIAQSKFHATPKYEMLESSGPDHDKDFVMQVTISNDKYGTGHGKSKQVAEDEAAKQTLEILG